MPRSRAPEAERIKTLEQRLAKVQRAIRLARAREKDQARRDDAHRKIVGGSLCENHALKNPRSDFATVYVRLLKEYVRPDDRQLFAHVFRALLPADEAEALLAEPLPSPQSTGTDANGIQQPQTGAAA